MGRYLSRSVGTLLVKFGSNTKVPSQNIPSYGQSISATGKEESKEPHPRVRNFMNDESYYINYWGIKSCAKKKTKEGLDF